MVCVIGLANWLRHSRNTNKMNCTSYEYTTNFWSQLPSFLSLSLNTHFFHYKWLPNCPSTHPKRYPFSPKTAPIFCPNKIAPALKLSFQPIRKLSSYNFCMWELKNTYKWVTLSYVPMLAHFSPKINLYFPANTLIFHLNPPPLCVGDIGMV